MNKNYKMYIVIFLLSLSTLAFELILARVFSYILAYHFVFIIIAFSILAHSLGQLFTAKLRKNSLFPYSKIFFLLLLGYPLSILITYYLSSIDSIGSGATGLLIYCLISGITFFLTGAICADIFQENNKDIGIFYALDLVGAAGGSLLGLFLLNNFEIFPALAVILIILSISFLLIQNLSKPFSKWILFSSIGAVILSFFIIFAFPGIDFKIVKSGEKDLLRIESNPSVSTEKIESRWNSFGKTDLVKITYLDGSSSMSMFIDGAAGTEVFDIEELKKDTLKLRHTLMHSNIFFPFYFLKDNEKRSALIIGPGGGKDIAMAYFGGVKRIDAVEVNPTFVDLMKMYNKSTFVDQSNVKVFVQEGRNFVRNTKNKYDIIFLTIPITKGGRSANFVNLTESYLFTEEALQDYLNALTSEGRIVFTLHNNEEVYKILSNYLDIQIRNGLSDQDAFKYLYAADQGMMPLVVIKKTPFTITEINLRHVQSHRLKFDEGISFFPYVKQVEIDTAFQGVNYEWDMFDKILEDVSQNKYDFHYVADKALINIHPVKDDSPFFFNYELGLPTNLSILIWAAFLLLLWTIFMFKKGWGIKFTERRESAYSVLQDELNLKKYFNYLGFITFILGFAYILLESFLFQALNLNLNNPVQSFSILLFAFLLGNGAGSFSTKIISNKRMNKLVYTLIALILIILLEFYFVFPAIKSSSSYLVLFLIVIVPSFLLGIPFPLVLKTLSEKNNENGTAILLGISGIAGFIGSIVAIVTAILAGYGLVMVLSLLSYLVLIIVLKLLSKKFYTIIYQPESVNLKK